ncbi:IclR family transcriptional regulator [Amycolatopsis taiwanensis]|uniref:IclR family transcriptional regulator n=1 Tax=Amycolatopsis taiwanensis TaxID=342230 RepID=UPI0004821BB2|nr:IclR family transcriptional regulator [Amycolatopsis taiwanensis]
MVDRQQGPAASSDDRANNSVAKALRVLEALADASPSLRLGEIAGQADVSKTTAHRILATLVTEGYADASEGRYTIGNRLRALAARAQANEASGIEAILRTLQQDTGLTVHLAVLSGEHATYTHTVDPPAAWRIATFTGMQVPLHCTAAGKVMLAALGSGERSTLLRKTGLAARTPNTITDHKALEEQLEAVRNRGWATDYEERELALCSLAAPVLDSSGYPLAAVEVCALTALTDRTALEALAGTVRLAALQVSRRI